MINMIYFGWNHFILQLIYNALTYLVLLSNIKKIPCDTKLNKPIYILSIIYIS